jgi:ABC-type transport system involved in multi-copper enzyme maturation permease subunit
MTTPPAMLRQTAALFVDAYRELNARKLFWVVLALSALFVLAFALVGINERGITLFWWEIPIPLFNTQTLPGKSFFYKFLFFTFGFQIWLTWIATALALVSTASIIPEFVSGGSIDTLLSKPLGRARLFLTKYLSGLLFAGLQVTVFTVAAFVVIGVRGEEWVWGLFVAIPLVVLFFSYIYVISALVGLLTRSTIAALLAALAFWFVIFITNTTEMLMLTQRTSFDQAVLILSSNRETQQAALANQAAQALQNTTTADADAATTPPSNPPAPTTNRRERQGGAAARQARPVTPEMLELTETNLAAAEADRQRWVRLHAWAYAVKTVLPKTTETMGLLERLLMSEADMATFADSAGRQAGMRDETLHGVRISAVTVQREVQKELRQRTAWWIIGTSLAFQAAVLAGAIWIFARRDY